MIEKYNEFFEEYKEFIKNNSEYEPRVVKINTNSSSYFPLITMTLSNTVSTDNCTIDKIEYYEQQYYTINIFTKDKIIGSNETVASQIINDELTSLTIQFFEKLNMKRTQCTYIPNFDTSVLRRNINYQGMIGNVRGNIIRR